ncbi:NUC091 domain-containing protein [Kalaharituber pfeilii]|nr:NUC091 domain-containing protein [Kalaharituber pfeilii]
MGTFKKEKARRERSKNPRRWHGKPIRNKQGDIIKAASYQSKEIPNARLEPNRKWFGNTRVIAQDALQNFREAMASKASDPYQAARYAVRHV